jgi:lipopolysaccharide export system protein LptA
MLALGFASPAAAVVEVSRPAAGLAVVSFAQGSSSVDLPDVASLLAGELSARSSARVVMPENLLSDGRRLDDPRAVDVRRWALRNAVENVIVGRSAVRGGNLDVAVELRSGHSGAARAEYHLVPESWDAVPGAVGRLAVLILADLGEDAGSVTDRLPTVSAARQPEESLAAESRSDEEPTPVSGGGEMALLPGTRRDEPISINSEELEVLPQAGGRRLVFSQNVEVHQGEINLRADRLEAIYPQGASQPERLVASGRVRVVQGERHASCDEAVYDRGPHTIVCRGKAEVLQDCDRVRGDQIEFDLGRESVRVTGSASVVIHPENDAVADCTATQGAGR